MTHSSTFSELSHFPVMLDEVVKICTPEKGGIFLDCTFGGGNYSQRFLKFSKTKVIALDRDSFIKNISKNLEKKYPKRFFFYQKKFSELNKVVKDVLVDAVIFDLGISSIQLNNLKRGFSFKSKDELDMKMGLSIMSAADVINSSSENQLKSIIKILGEEKDASKIARNIVKARSEKKITKVNQLVKIIEKSKIKNFKNKINPCTKTFQALRIFVNKEISELITGIINATRILKPGGKLLVLSFHSIEDKIVKYYFSNFSLNKSKPSRYLPDINLNSGELFNEYKNKVIRPTKKELNQNPPSRSAKLRFAIRSSNEFIYPTGLTEKFHTYLNLENADI